MSPPRTREREFTTYLCGFADREERAPLAALRRGLGKPPGEAAEMYRYVVPFLRRESRWSEEEAYYLVAALFALHQGNWPADGSGDAPASTNFGASLAWLAREVEGDSVERRFVALLNSHRDELPDHLRHGVGLLKAHGIPVDWAQLLRDLQEWEWESRSVQRAWARAFWRRPERETPGESPADDEAAGSGQVSE